MKQILAGSEPYFSNFVFQANFSKLFGEVWKITLEKVWIKVWKTGANSEGTCFFGGDLSDALRALFPRGRSQT
jgi:predicted phosphohydrolase